MPMQKYLAALTLVLMLGMVLTRTAMLRRAGVRAMKFGAMDKRDFLIPPFACFYFYHVFAAAFGWPAVDTRTFFESVPVAWAGVTMCGAGLTLLLCSLVSFGRSFRVGIDADRLGRLVTTGIFALSRNPIYVGFAVILLGQFLIFPNWILLVYAGAGAWLFHRQVLLEEDFLRHHYGQEYLAYCDRVRRYL